MPATSLSIDALNARRREAVRLRLDGQTLGTISRRVGLSAPTIVSAVKAWRRGGWDAVDVKPRGRPRGYERSTDPEALRLALFGAMQAAATSASPLWTRERIQQWLASVHAIEVSLRSVANYLDAWGVTPHNRHRSLRTSGCARLKAWRDGMYSVFQAQARARRASLLWIALAPADGKAWLLQAYDARGRFWCARVGKAPTEQDYAAFFDALLAERSGPLALVLPSRHLADSPALLRWQSRTGGQWTVAPPFDVIERNTDEPQTAVAVTSPPVTDSGNPMSSQPALAEPGESPEAISPTLTHLERLEAESLHIMREVVAEADNPVMLYSIGKDSAVMLHLAQKAFYPARLPFPLLHVDTTWKFRAMYEFRDRMRDEVGFDLLTYTNPEGVAKGVNPFTHGSALHTDIMKTEALKQALNVHRFDVAFGGARRDEEKSRAKERIFSFRSAQHRWEPKNQRPELWKLYNTRKQPGESIRVFPLSNWTELDIWQYIHQQNIPIVPLYFAAERPVVLRDGMLIMVDDERMPLNTGEVPVMRTVRFRTLGCYPLTGAVESSAASLPAIIQEMLLARTSERQGRMIDHDSAASMEKKKQEGYF